MLYTYSKEVHPLLMVSEIEASSITIALDTIIYENLISSITFKADLSAAEVTELDALVAAHNKDNYVEEITPVVTTFAKQEENDDNIPYVYASPRPMNHYSYFTSAGDNVAVGDGTKLMFDMSITDTSKFIDITFIEDVYLKDGLIQCKDAPFGASVDIDIHHPVAGFLLSFGKQVPLYGSFPIMLNTEDRALVQAGLIIRVTVHNATGANGDDAAAAFKCIGRLELYRPKPLGL